MIKKVAAAVVILMLLGAVLVNTKKVQGFYLIREEGEVQYKLPESNQYVALNQDEITLPTGSSIKLIEYSSAHIVLPDNSLLSLDQNTEVKVNIVEGNISIEQLTGNTWNRVETLTNGKQFEIKAVDTTISTEGTIFGINIAPGSVSTNVEDGKVLVQAANNSLTIEEGQSAISSEGSATKSDIPSQLKMSRWYIRNKVLDVIKRTGLDNIFLKDKLKKELQREDLIETRFNPPTSEIKDSILKIVTGSENTQVCNEVENIPDYATYSKYSSLYQSILSSCEDEILTSEEIDNLGSRYSEVK